MIKIGFIIILLNFYFISFPQSNLERTFNSLTAAAGESVSLYDIPAAGLLISSAFFPIKIDDKLKIGTFSFDAAFRETFSVEGSHSPGNMEPRRYPENVFLGRLAFTTTAGLFFGMDTKESYKHTLVFMKAVLYNQVITDLFKNITHRERPDQSDSRSFFSGHTSTTFATSTFLYREINELINNSDADNTLRTALKTTSFAALYGWAAYVGYSRMRDDKHYFSDVLIGAAAGTIISTYFYNLYFEDDPGILDNFSLGYRNNQPVISLFMNF